MKLQSGWEEAHSACPMFDRGKPMGLELAPLGPRLLPQPSLSPESRHFSVPLVHGSQEPLLHYSP